MWSEWFSLPPVGIVVSPFNNFRIFFLRSSNSLSLSSIVPLQLREGLPDRPSAVGALLEDARTGSYGDTDGLVLQFVPGQRRFCSDLLICALRPSLTELAVPVRC